MRALVYLFAGFFLLLWLGSSMEEPAEPEIIQENCKTLDYRFRARPEQIEVCKQDGVIIYEDSGLQSDSTRQLMIMELLEELE